VAYSYGGNDDTLSYLGNLADSLAAGNHMCHYQNYGAETGIYPPDWSTGIDCSAFVCRCWQVPRTNTGGIFDKYYPVKKEDVQPGDVLVKPASHVILISDPGETPGAGTFALYEASGSTCRVWYNPSASWSYYSAYSARSLFSSGDDDSKDDYDTSRLTLTVEPAVAKGRILLRFSNILEIDAIDYEIFDVTGRRVCKGQVTGPGFQAYWHGIDETGRILPSGVYGVRAVHPEYSGVERFVLLK